MHELSVATSLLNIVEQEMAKHNTTRLISVSVKYGKLSNIVPEALSFAFEALNRESERQDAKLDLAKEKQHKETVEFLESASPTDAPPAAEPTAEPVG